MCWHNATNSKISKSKLRAGDSAVRRNGAGAVIGETADGRTIDGSVVMYVRRRAYDDRNGLRLTSERLLVQVAAV